ncbi:hypothetical protein [Pontivivens ytuae]|uniref:hypothetical protein n=1 Tax=Pontivivens ytuae TaxID=2789856 RepID=UPI001E62054D|nr:hypothetical protein [Pontivivens ytuae]
MNDKEQPEEELNSCDDIFEVFELVEISVGTAIVYIGLSKEDGSSAVTSCHFIYEDDFVKGGARRVLESFQLYRYEALFQNTSRLRWFSDKRTAVRNYRPRPRFPPCGEEPHRGDPEDHRDEG